MTQINCKIVKETVATAILALYRQAGWWSTEDKDSDLEIITKIVANSFCFVIFIAGKFILLYKF